MRIRAIRTHIGRTQKVFLCQKCGRELKNTGNICTPCRNGRSILGHARNTASIDSDLHGEAFFRAFDTAFGLQPITEFSYLLRYFERLSVNADEVRATPPEPIARAVSVLRHHQSHLSSPRNYEAATGLTSPLVAAITNDLLQTQEARRAISTSKHGDRSNGERAFPIVYSPLLSITGFSPVAVISSYVHTLAPPAKASVGMPETQAPGSNLGGATSNHKAERQAGDNRAASS